MTGVQTCALPISSENTQQVEEEVDEVEIQCQGSDESQLLSTLAHIERHYRAFSTAEPVPRLEATLRVTQQCQPSTSVTGQLATGEGATVDTAKNGPAAMVVAGGRKQQSRRQPSSRPIQGQQGNPLSWREDGALVSCSSNGSHAQRLPREPLVPSH